MMNWNKGTNEQVSKIEHIQCMQDTMDEICTLLSKDTQRGNDKKYEDLFFQTIYEYINSNERLLYTNLTNYIFELNDQEFGVLLTNLESIVDYMYDENYKNSFIESSSDKYAKRKYERTQRAILKLWDHVHLARRQYDMFQYDNDDYAKIVDEKMEIKKVEIARDMNTQMISLIAIFTALSFLVFGGISSLDNIFAGAKDIPVLKLIIVGDIWSFCIMNLVFAFMFFAGKMTGLSIRSTDDVNANIIKRYPLVCWCNFVLIAIFLISFWLYYVRRFGYSKEIDSIISTNPTAYVVSGIFLIGVFLYIVGYNMYKLWMK